MHEISFTRSQILIITSFAVMEYKVQEAIFQTVILDLQWDYNAKSKRLYKRFYSTYSKLSRLQILDGV